MLCLLLSEASSPSGRGLTPSLSKTKKNAHWDYLAVSYTFFSSCQRQPRFQTVCLSWPFITFKLKFTSKLTFLRRLSQYVGISSIHITLRACLWGVCLKVSPVGRRVPNKSGAMSRNEVEWTFMNWFAPLLIYSDPSRWVTLFIYSLQICQWRHVTVIKEHDCESSS